ncbi:MAG TPA: hypothetical protein VL475_01515 [Planctomycetaceae bacterium]|nr:hypothetical protein [Planctomycetaceae bacterium]
MRVVDHHARGRETHETQRLGQKHLVVKTPEVRRIGAENNFFPSVSSCWMAVDGVALGNVRLVRYADDMVLLAQAWEQLQVQFAALQLVVNQEKSRLTTLAAGFALLGFEFRKAPGRMLLRGPRHKACRNVRQRVREAVRSIPLASAQAPVPLAHRQETMGVIGEPDAGKHVRFDEGCRKLRFRGAPAPYST